VCYTIPMLGKLTFEEDEGMEQIMNIMKKMLEGNSSEAGIQRIYEKMVGDFLDMFPNIISC
jgi:hypothetical protein